MPNHQTINPFSKVNNDTGFGTSDNYGGRFINRDGSFNIRREGRGFWERFSLFHSMLSLPVWKFTAVLVVFFIGINLIFTLIYIAIGSEQFVGMVSNDWWQDARELYYFSTQTFTTVGYGRVNPVGDMASFVAGIEAMLGFITFAIITGLIYGRFARPRTYLLFSEHAVIAPYRGGRAFMFRFASYKDSHILTDVDIRVNAALKVDDAYQFYDLKLERNKVDSLSMNWTVVHPIDDQSPLNGFTEEDMKTSDLEIYVMVRGFDDVYSNFVLRRTSYTYHEIKMDRKFVPMYRESEDGKTTIVEIHKINDHKEVPAPH
ncbi:MAG: ion channel [Bacteroidota bacterium]